MSDQSNATTAVLSDEDKAKAFAALMQPFQDAINGVNGTIDIHNGNCLTVRNAASDNIPQLLAEIREKNTAKDPELASIQKKIEAIDEQREKLIAQADKLAAKQLPKKKSPAEVTAAREATKETSKQISVGKQTLKNFEEMLKMSEGSLTQFLHEADSLKGVRAGGADSQYATRPTVRFDQAFINDDEVKRDVKQSDGSIKVVANSGIIAQELTKRLNGDADVSAVDVTVAFLKSIGLDPTQGSDVKPGQYSFDFVKDVPAATDESGVVTRESYQKTWTVRIIKS